jgi:hypothetical protein
MKGVLQNNSYLQNSKFEKYLEYLEIFFLYRNWFIAERKKFS